MCELCPSTVAAERYRRESRASAVEPFLKIAPHKNSTRLLLFVSFSFVFFLVRTQPVTFCEKRKFVRFISFFSSFFLPSLIPALRPILMQSETRIEKAGFRSVIFPTGL